jgi:hypothetical protein
VLNILYLIIQTIYIKNTSTITSIITYKMSFKNRAAALYTDLKKNVWTNSGSEQRCSIFSFLQCLFHNKAEKHALASSIENALNKVNQFGANIPDGQHDNGGFPPSADRFTLFANLCDTRIIIIDNTGMIWAIDPEEHDDVRLHNFWTELSQKHAQEFMIGLETFRLRKDKFPIVITWIRNVHFEALNPSDHRSVMRVVDLFTEQDEERTHKLLIEALARDTTAVHLNINVEIPLAAAFASKDDGCDDDEERDLAHALKMSCEKLPLPQIDQYDIFDINIELAIKNSNATERERIAKEIESDRKYAQSLQQDSSQIRRPISSNVSITTKSGKRVICPTRTTINFGTGFSTVDQQLVNARERVRRLEAKKAFENKKK